MWWLFIDPDDAGPVLVVTFILIFIFCAILFGVHKCNPDALKQTNNIIEPNTKKTEHVITYDTILNNDSTLILRKK